MNPRLALPILSAMAGIAAGWLAGASIPRKTLDSSKPDADGGLAPSRHRSTGTVDPALPLDFASYVKRVAKPAEKEEAEQAAARMSNDELREVLLGLPIFNWEAGVSKEDFALYRASEAIAAELLRREGPAVLDWVATTGKQSAFAALLQACCVTEGKPPQNHLITYHTTFKDRGGGWQFHTAATNAAALRGASDLLEVQKLWQSSGSDNVSAFAADFDFAAYFAKAGFNWTPADPLIAWVGKDPEAAGAALARGLREGHEWGSVVGKAVESRALLAGEEEAARWVAPMIAGASGENRDWALSSLAQDLSAARATALMSALTEDRDRIALVLGTIRGDYNGTHSVRALRALPSEELQVQALTEAMSGKDRRSQLRSRESRLNYLNKVTPKLGLSEAARQRVMAAVPAE